MKVTFHGHAAVAVEHDGRRLAFDPGVFGDVSEALSDATTVLLTHEHPDHVDMDAVRERVRGDAAVEVWAPGDLATALAAGLPDDAARRVHVASAGGTFRADGFAVRVGGGLHAVIHPDIPRIANATYLVSAGGTTVYHPGDSFDRPDIDGRVDVLCTPVSGPWMKMAEAIDFARDLDPRVVVPIHEALLSQLGLGMVDQRLGTARTGGTYEYRRLGRGETVDVSPSV